MKGVGKGNHKNHARGSANGRYTGQPWLRHDPLYRLWYAIKNRCTNPDGQDWKYYGGRGITFCTRWDSFDLFVADVGPHPGDGWTLDRIDNDGDYEPGNVRWATRKTQGRNCNYCVLNLQLAAKIRAAYAQGAKQVELATQYGVSQTAISQVIRGKIWL